MLDRIKEVISYYDETASSFADKIGVPRSSISHILSGRNKPSLDFILKLFEAYPDINLHWFLYGKGNIQTTSNSQKMQEPINERRTEHDAEKRNSVAVKNVVIFYEDGTFESYLPKI
jgi:transcriptional regulator with XRE-family HTH domain